MVKATQRVSLVVLEATRNKRSPTKGHTARRSHGSSRQEEEEQPKAGGNKTKKKQPKKKTEPTKKEEERKTGEPGGDDKGVEVRVKEAWHFGKFVCWSAGRLVSDPVRLSTEPHRRR